MKLVSEKEWRKIHYCGSYYFFEGNKKYEVEKYKVDVFVSRKYYDPRTGHTHEEVEKIDTYYEERQHLSYD